MKERKEINISESGEIILKTAPYKRLKKDFARWLATLGYAPSTIYGLPRQLGEFLSWMECRDKTQIEEITQEDIDRFLNYFKNRPNRRKAGGLSISHINKQIDSLQKFIHYLRVTGQGKTNIRLKLLEEENPPERTVLTKTEIQQLYSVTDNDPIGMRDRAMLAVYYGCGLRKSEGTSLEVSDILFERRLLYVRKAKNQQERYVPVNLKALQDLETYIYTARPLLLNDRGAPGGNKEALFISERGTPIQGQSLARRLDVLRERCRNPGLQNKRFGLHALRHSIATHLLQAGIELENIALFLGHKTLDSTQLYTHIIHEI